LRAPAKQSNVRHSGMARKRQTRNLEIPGSMLAHRPGMTIWKDPGLLRRYRSSQ
jgi:hypothetical protein